jgi:hypothetical protein
MPARVYCKQEKRLIIKMNRAGESHADIAYALEQRGFERAPKHIRQWLSDNRIKERERPFLVFGDFHAPYQHKNAIEFLLAVQAKYNCRDHVYCTGDLFDFHSMSRFTTEIDSPSPSDEYDRALAFVSDLTNIFPLGTLVLGNHDRIPQRQMKEASLTDNLLKSHNELYGLPVGWDVEPLYTVIPETDTLIEHGIGSNGINGAINTAVAKESNYAQGHTHSYAGAFIRSNHRGLRWALNTGCLVDNTSLAMRYGRYMKHKGVLGCGLIWQASGMIAEHPQFVPMGFGG